MRLALLSCQNLPTWEQDDRFLHAHLDECGLDWSIHSWDEELDWSQFDCVLIRTTWDYMHRLEEFLHKMRWISQQTRLLNDIEMIAWNIQKTYLRDLENAGIPIAPTHWFQSGVSIDLAKHMTDLGCSKAFLKPVVGACAVDTRRFEQRHIPEIEPWLQQMLVKGRGMMLQPYIETVETEGEYSILYFGSQVSHCVQKIPVAGDYRVQDDYGASDVRIPSDRFPQMMQIGEQVRTYIQQRFSTKDAVPILMRVDFLRSQTGEFWVNEVELIEPSLFLRHATKEAPKMLVRELCLRMR